MKFEFVPWPNFADRMLNELNSGGKLCDLLIGDSQWIGGSAENGHYVKLNDFFDKEGIKMDDFAPATVYAYSTWPKGTPNYWALPAMGDAIGWIYRKDWFAKPELQAEFKAKYSRDLAAPKTWTELKEIAEFFQGREIDGKKVYGAAIFTERGSEGITMGVDLALYPFGFKYERPRASPTTWKASSTRADAVEGPRSSTRRSTSAARRRATPTLHGAKASTPSSPARWPCMMNWFAFLPGPGQGREGRRRQDRLLRQSRREGRRPRTLGGQGISVVANTDNMDDALAYIKWFAQPDVQKKWWSLGGYSCHNAGAERSGLRQDAQPFAGDFLDAMGRCKDFWAGAVLRPAAAGHAEARP